MATLAIETPVPWFDNFQADSPDPFAPLGIVVGDHQLLANTPDQTIPIYVTGGQLIQGVNFNAQIADGGPAAGGGTVGPAIQGIDLLSGTIFAANHDSAGTDLDGPHLDSVPQWEGRNLTTTAGEVVADGLLATLTIDTTGFDGGAWPLLLSDTVNGSTDFPADNPPNNILVPTVTAGSIHINNIGTACRIVAFAC